MMIVFDIRGKLGIKIPACYIFISFLSKVRLKNSNHVEVLGYVLGKERLDYSLV